LLPIEQDKVSEKASDPKTPGMGRFSQGETGTPGDPICTRQQTPLCFIPLFQVPPANAVYRNNVRFLDARRNTETFRPVLALCRNGFFVAQTTIPAGRRLLPVVG